MPFDAYRYRIVRQRWSTALDMLLGPATEIMLDSIVKPGMMMLDVAAGTGEQTVRAARRVGPQGRVVATDIAEAPLRFADEEARSLGILNVTFRADPCENLNEPDGKFDAAISRNGLQYLADLPRGLSEIRRVLKAGCGLGVIAWSSADRNPFLSRSFAIGYRKRNMRPPGPDEPGPFRLGYDRALQSALEGARFDEVRVVPVNAPAWFASAGEALLFQQQAGGELLRLLDELSDDDRADAWREIEDSLRVFERDGLFVADGELLVGTCIR